MFSKSVGSRVVAVLMVMLLVLSFTGCVVQDKQQPPTQSDGTDTGSDISTLISPTRLKIRAWCPERIDAPINNELLVFKELIERTNIEFDWELAPTASEKEKFNLMMSTGDIPDIVFFGDSSIIPYAEAGLFEPLSGLIEEHAPNLKKYLIDDPAVRRATVFDDGEIYYVVRTSTALVGGGFMIREDWLDKLNLPLPVTLDEWYETMAAFKTGKINDNEVIWPFTGRWDIDDIKHFMGAWGLDFYWFTDNDQVKCGVYEPAAKEAITWIRKLYVDKMLDPDIFVNNASAWEARITNEISGWTRDSRGRADTLTVTLKQVNPDAQFIGIAPPTGPAGSMSFDKGEVTAGRSAAIKKGSKYKVELIKFLDYGYSEEGLNLHNFGIEGVTYSELTDKKVVFTDKIMGPDGVIPGAIMNFGMDRNIPFPYDSRLEMGYRGKGTLSVIEAQMPILRDEFPEGSIKYTDAERDEYNSKWLDMETYITEEVSKFVMGIEPMDKWDEFVQALNRMGIEDVLKIQDTAYKRFLSR